MALSVSVRSKIIGKLKRFATGLLRAAGSPFRWLGANVERGDVSFCAGLALLGYGFWLVARPYGFIVAGFLLIVNAWAPAVLDLLTLFAGYRLEKEGEGK